MNKKNTAMPPLSTFQQKLMLVNHLRLPYEIIENEIKPYCFQNIMQGKVAKAKKATNVLICTALSTRGNLFGGFDENEEQPYWAFGFADGNEKLQLQAANCNTCGNYNHYNTPDFAIRVIMCRCNW